MAAKQTEVLFKTPKPNKIKMGTDYAVARKVRLLPGGVLPPRKMTCIDIKGSRFVMQYESWEWVDARGNRFLSSDHGWIYSENKTPRRVMKLVEVKRSEVIGLWSDFVLGGFKKTSRGWRPKPLGEQAALV